MRNTQIKIFYTLLFTLFSFVAQAQIIRTIAGNGVTSFANAKAMTGVGLRATDPRDTLGVPHGVAVDTAGNVYFTDNYFHILKKIAPNGIVSVVAGNGFPVYMGDGGPATASRLSNPTALLIDATGNIYVGDAGNKVVRMISPSGIITRVAGNPSTSVYGSGNGGPATNAGLGSISGLAKDAAGNLYIADGNTRVRKVTPAGIITTVVGSGTLGSTGNGGQATAAAFDGITDVAVDAAGNIYVTDKSNATIRKVNTAGIVNVYAGTSGVLGSTGDGGQATAARLNGPSYLKFDAAGNLYVSDQSNNKIRMITPAGIITSVIGSGAGVTGDGGPPLPAKFLVPAQFCFDSRGNTYIAERGSSPTPGGHRIRQVFKVDQFHISVTPSNTLCGNTAATYTAHPAYAYYAYEYRWKVNGVTVGPNALVYASTNVHNNDTVTCSIIDTANGGMLLAYSDTIIMTVLPPILPAVHVTSTGDTVCAGLPITFTAHPINGGASPTYKWFVNGIYRASGITFTYIPVTGDYVTCEITSNDPCAFPHTGHVDIPVSIIPSFRPAVVVTASPSNVLSHWGEIITFFTTLTYEGTVPTFQWYNKDGEIPGATTSSYFQEMYSGDTVYCVMHSNGYCAVPATDTSEYVYIKTGTLDVNDINTPSTSFSIYPNPNNGSFTLRGVAHGQLGGNINIEIRNVLGQSVYKNSINHANGSIELPVQLKDISPGMYYLITSDDHVNRATSFMVK